MADARTSTTIPPQQTGTVAQNERSEQKPAVPQPPPRREEPPQNRLLWTPTPGQDVTKSLFPLNKTATKP